MYAIHISDLLILQRDHLALRLVLNPLVCGQAPVEVDRALFDGFAVPLNCDDERAAAIIKIIRLRYPQREHTIRCYHSPTGRGARKKV